MRLPAQARYRFEGRILQFTFFGLRLAVTRWRLEQDQPKRAETQQ